ncbi:hypothetical protein [Botrimarina hoheduenensis]|uniref:FecR protein n=1 Tax=Botrimarina hoheduenensis TaxID=2528000 RepID=A0A5C5WFQ7_9BACT|nr:hypothetical protein [Botrimarina hoheduenensis]TWT48592.1 hypothetical protein Pla111_03670 [Botrimarina hoheduenensis]
MAEAPLNNELQGLLADWCNATIDACGAARLEQLLASDPQARQYYLEYAAAEAELYALHTSAPLARPVVAEQREDASADKRSQPAIATVGGALDPAARSAAVDRSAARRALSVAELSSAGRPTPSRAWSANIRSALALAASLAVVAAGSSWLTWRAISSADQSAGTVLPDSMAADSITADRLAVAAKAVTGTITGTRNCRWGSELLGRDEAGLGYGSELRVGDRLDLVAGIAEITFNDGARAVLEGPAELIMPAENDAVLLSGRLAAFLPPGNPSPGIRTGRMGVSLASLDAKGTGPEFCLAADAERGDEVHVFRGDLQAFLLGGAGVASRSVRLAKHEAARVRPASTTVAKFFADEDKFVRSISSTGGPHDGLYAYDGFDYPQGPLGQQNGGFGWAGPWADIEAACPPGQIATNVAEIGSLRMPGLPMIGGRAAQVAQQNRVRRALSTSLGGVFDAAGMVENQDGLRLVGANGKTVYLSFLQRVDLPGDGFYGFELHRGDGNGNRVLCIGSGADGAGYGVTSNYNAYGAANYPRMGAERDEPSLYVIKIEFGPQHRDVVTVLRNPVSLLDERGAEATAQLRGNFAFDRISFGNFDGKKCHEVDEVRVGTTYRAVTGRRDRGADWLVPEIAGPINRSQPLAESDGRDHNNLASVSAVRPGYADTRLAGVLPSRHPLFATEF